MKRGRCEKKEIRKIIDSLQIEKKHKSIYYDFGYNIFGPFLYGYTFWLKKNIEKGNYKKIFFFSRDGYMMEKAFELLNVGKINSEYVYFSRKSIRQALLNQCTTYKESLKYLTWERFISFGKLLEYYGFSTNERREISRKVEIELEHDFLYSELENNKSLQKIYLDLKEIIVKKSVKQEVLLKNYLRQINMYGKCAIVDIGWHGSMQFFLEEFIKTHNMNIEIDGYYVGTTSSFQLEGKANGYLYDDNDQSLRKSILCFFGGYEKLFQSLEGSTYGYKEKNKMIVPELAEYEYINDTDAQRCIKEWQIGALDFVKNVKMHQFLIKDERQWAIPIIQFGKNPTMKDIELFRFFYNTDGTKEYFVSQKSLFKYKPKELIHALSNSVWKTGFMKSVFKVPLPYYKIYELMRK